MSALTRWNQLKELEALRHGLGSLFGRSPVHLPEGQEEQIAVPEWAPAVDISEDDREYLITAELPGVKKEDVKVAWVSEVVGRASWPVPCAGNTTASLNQESA